MTPETPPAFLWHTATDGSVPIRNSMEFATACWNNGVKAELHVFPEGPHGHRARGGLSRCEALAGAGRDVPEDDLRLHGPVISGAESDGRRGGLYVF